MVACLQKCMHCIQNIRVYVYNSTCICIKTFVYVCTKQTCMCIRVCVHKKHSCICAQNKHTCICIYKITYFSRDGNSSGKVLSFSVFESRFCFGSLVARKRSAKRISVLSHQILCDSVRKTPNFKSIRTSTYGPFPK